MKTLEALAATETRLNDTFDKLTKARARIAELEAILTPILDDVVECHRCLGTGKDIVDETGACHICGGYGFNPGGDIREHMLSIRKLMTEAQS